jgi:hypothetical protein
MTTILSYAADRFWRESDTTTTYLQRAVVTL